MDLLTKDQNFSGMESNPLKLVRETGIKLRNGIRKKILIIKIITLQFKILIFLLDFFYQTN